MKPRSQGASCGGETESKRPRFAPALELWLPLVGATAISARVNSLGDLDIVVCRSLSGDWFTFANAVQQAGGCSLDRFGRIHGPCVIRSAYCWSPLSADQV